MMSTATEIRRLRVRWSAIGAAVAVSLGAGGLGIARADIGSGSRPVTVTVEPRRVLDTRTNLGLAGRFADSAPRDLQITGSVPVEPSGKAVVVPADATGVLVNVTVVNPSSPGFLSLRPAGASGVPTTSTVNFASAGAIVPNSATVALGPGGKVQIWLETAAAGGVADVLIDVVGYTVGHHHDDLYYTKAQVDSRVGAVGAEVDALTTIAIGGSAFVSSAPEGGGVMDSVVRSTGGCVYNSTDTSALVAPVEVPIGYKVVAISGGFFDISPTANATVTVVRGALNSINVARVQTSGSAGAYLGVPGTILADLPVESGEWMYLSFTQGATTSGTVQLCAVELTLAPG